MCRDESPIGTWEIKVTDRVNPDKVGRFIAWSLQLWGEAIDASSAKTWAPAEEGQPDEEQTGSDPYLTVSQKPKPTAHLPGDHGEASGEADQPGLGQPTSLPTAGGDGGADEDIEVPTGDEGVDEGWFDGIEGLGGRTNWLAGAGAIVLLSGGAIGGFFILKARRKRRNLFGLASGGAGARGTYAPVDENVPMGLLERGRRKLGGRGGGEGAAGTKDLYDAFGDGPSDESDDDGVDERAGLRYHDEFLGDDEDGEEGQRGDPPGYRDDEPPRGLQGGQHSGSGSSSSWQDAAEDVSRT
jgi:kexin